MTPRFNLRWGSRAVTAATICLAVAGCAEELPDDVADYRERCIRMNAEPIAVTSDDPHEGVKDVFACNVELEVLLRQERPFPDGTIIVKESTRSDSDFPWLVATARKQGEGWAWDEYTRNFDNEPFLRILGGESSCIDCHRRVEAVDWIYTFFSASQ